MGLRWYQRTASGAAFLLLWGLFLGGPTTVDAASLLQEINQYDGSADIPPLTDGLPVAPPPLADTDEAADDRVTAAAGPVIDLWYGETERFGHNGQPLRWVNILGNVQSANSIASLTYRLNGGSALPLDIGPWPPAPPEGPRRLYGAGDFNVEIAYTSLVPGNNTVLISARDSTNAVSTRTATIVYTAGQAAPLPYAADWSVIDEIDEAAQIVDGRWVVENAALRPVELGYDRLVAIGGIDWETYEATVPVVLHSLDADGFRPPSSGPGLGLLAHWQGHYKWPEDVQLANGWQQFGALAWLRWSPPVTNPTAGLQMLGRGGGQICPNPDGSTNCTTFNNLAPAFEQGYIMKLRVEKEVAGCANFFYRFRIWQQGAPEPAAWNMAGCGSANEPGAGSLLLVAHQVDASFGTVLITPLDYDRPQITTGVEGEGTIAVSPQRSDYAFWEEVSLTATPSSGHLFDRWEIVEGADAPQNITANPYTFHIRADTQVTAHFLNNAYSLNVTTNGQGSVAISPDKAAYSPGETVTLTAQPAAGWSFDRWAGSVTGTASPIDLQMNSNAEVTAVFTEDLYTLAVALVDTEGSPIASGVNVNQVPLSAEGYLYDEMVTLTAQPGPGWRFVHWLWEDATQSAANPTSVTMVEDRAVDAVFVRQFTLATAVQGQGAIAVNPSGPYDDGAQVVVEAVAPIGWAFMHWEGDLSGSVNPAVIAMERNQSIVAVFAPAAYTLTLNTNGSGSIQATPAGPYGHGQVVTLEAIPAANWAFAGWSGALTGTQTPASLTMTDDVIVSASFVESGPSVYLPLIRRRP